MNVRRLTISFLVCVLCAHVPSYGDENRSAFEVESASTSLKDGVYMLDAEIRYEFTEVTLDALHNGVPLTIEIQIQVFRDRDYVWDEDIASLEQHYQISFHALAERYVINNLNSGTQLTVATWGDVLRNLSQLRRYPMLDHSLIQAGKRYQARLRARLDIEALPLPLRTIAYFYSQWRLESDWYRWQLAL